LKRRLRDARWALGIKSRTVDAIGSAYSLGCFKFFARLADSVLALR
jgi:hypothetical protein